MAVRQEGTGNALFPFFFCVWMLMNPLDVAGQYRRLDPRHFMPDSLELAILEAANRERIRKGLPTLVWDDRLGRSARRYSRDMAERRKISHETRTPGLKTLSDRLKRFGIPLMNATVAENLAVDYCLNISDIPYFVETRSGKKEYIDANTGQPIRPHSYQSFARQTVAHWMESPGHRRNLLNPEFESLGVGASVGRYQGLDAVYVTQHFWGSLEDDRDR
jgi:uncharacterized protein YkwD